MALKDFVCRHDDGLTGLLNGYGQGLWMQDPLFSSRSYEKFIYKSRSAGDAAAKTTVHPKRTFKNDAAWK